MSKGKIYKGKEDFVFFEYTSWAHRYKVLNPDGTVKYKKKKGFLTEEEALASYKIYKEEFERQKKEFNIVVNADQNITIKEYLNYWFKNIFSPRVENNTITVGSYVVYYLILPSISDEEDTKLTYITTEFITTVIERAGKLAKCAAVFTRQFLNISFKDAIQYGYIKQNPVAETASIAMPKPEIQILSKKQIKRFLEYAQYTNVYLEILLGLFCGLRKGEIAGLKFNDFNVEEKYVKIERQLAVKHNLKAMSCKSFSSRKVECDPKTEAGKRKFMVPDIILIELEKRKKQNDFNKKFYNELYTDNDYVSCQANGLPHGTTILNDQIERICNKLSLPHITVHSLRHMCATALLENQVDLAVISAMLGHTSVHTTFDYYCEVMDEDNKILSFLNSTFNIEKNGYPRQEQLC